MSFICSVWMKTPKIFSFATVFTALKMQQIYVHPDRVVKILCAVVWLHYTFR